MHLHKILKPIGGLLLTVDCLFGLVKSSLGQELRECSFSSECKSVTTASLLQMKKGHFVGDWPRRPAIARQSLIALSRSGRKRSSAANDPASSCLKSIDNFVQNGTAAHWQELAREANEFEANQSHSSFADLDNPARALLVIYGLQNRDQRCALPSHLHIRDTLRTMGFMVDVFVYEMKPPQGAKVDNIPWSSGSLRDIASTYESEDVAVADRFIFERCGENLTTCKYWSGRTDERYQPPEVVQTLRQLYTEQVVANYLERKAQDAYQLVIAVSLDVYFGVSINPTDVRQAADASNINDLFLSPNCDCGGYTNGFYMGSARAVATAMSRFDFSNGIVYENYEEQLKGFSDAAGLAVKRLTGHIEFESFRKIRHDGSMKRCFCKHRGP